MRAKHGMNCTDGMELFHRVLDNDLMEATERQAMEAHLADCSECAEKAAQLREMQDLLRGMAEQPMPDDAVEEVWERTVRSPDVRTRPRWRDWRFAAAAAVVVLAVLIGLQFPPGPDPRVTENQPDPEQAAREVRMVLQLTANALKRSEEVVFREVFAEEVSPALQKVGILWPQASRNRGADEGQI
jgi:anti-sigma factor RsiW